MKTHEQPWTTMENNEKQWQTNKNGLEYINVESHHGLDEDSAKAP